MSDLLQDGFVVYVRDRSGTAGRPDAVERAVATCPSHDDAARVREKLRQRGRSCVIRCVGPTGGGD